MNIIVRTFCGKIFCTNSYHKNFFKTLYDTYFDPRNVINLIKMSENDVIKTKFVPQNLAQFLQERHMVLACRMYWLARHHFLSFLRQLNAFPKPRIMVAVSFKYTSVLVILRILNNYT